MQVSAYTDAEYVEVADTPRFTATSFTLAGRVPTVTWVAAALTLGVRLYWAQHTTGTDPGDPSDYVDEDAATGTITLSLELLDGESVTLRLEAWSGYSSGVVDGDEGENVAATLARTPPNVEAHAHTHHAGGTDELDLGQLVITAPDGGRWVLTVSNSGELGAEVVS